MKLYCVGCGPGDPELLTVKAVDIIKAARGNFCTHRQRGQAEYRPLGSRKAFKKIS